MSTATLAAVAPKIDWAAFAPITVLAGGAVLVLLTGLIRSAVIERGVVPLLAIATLAASGVLAVGQWDTSALIVSDALAADRLTWIALLITVVGAVVAVLLSLRASAPEETGHAEYYSLLLTAVLGMVTVAASVNFLTLFVGLELFSVALYVLSASQVTNRESLESGFKYLVYGAAASATLMFGVALLYGASGSISFHGVQAVVSEQGLQNDTLFIAGSGLLLIGLAFKASIAPLHQWAPDVYEGAPTPITTFMAVTTKVAVFAVLLRFLEGAVYDSWGPILAVLAVVTILVGNVGALKQVSLKRLLAYSGVAQAGYLLVAIAAPAYRLSDQMFFGELATVNYLIVYLIMNVAAFAVVVVSERDTGLGDSIDSLKGLAARRPGMAVVITVAMLSLAGIPGTAGFIGKLYLIQSAIESGSAWLGVAIVVGSMISLAYYLRVIAAVWFGKSNSEESKLRVKHRELTAVATLFGLATVAFGVYPQPLYELAQSVAQGVLLYL